MGMKLLIGNKNYSSWSLRPWILLRHAGISFEEEVISFNADDFGERVRRHSPVGKVPVLIDGDVVVWDSLAIVEYVAERFPDRQLWPEERAARALARSVCAEMHSGFQAMRSQMTMNCQVKFTNVLLTVQAQRDVRRIVDLWGDCRARFGAGGPFLFGRFSVPDAYFAPVVRRFLTYGTALPDVAQAYVDTIDRLPAMQEWVAAARAENDFVPEDEPYRESP
jgi:glutathione S-transferase